MTLKQLRGKKITQSHLASLLFVSQSFVSAWERNIRQPDFKLVPKMAQILKCSIEDIVLCFCDE